MAANSPPLSESETPDRISVDQEAWLLDRLMTLTSITDAIRRSKQCVADDAAIESAIEGAAHGTACEIIRLLGLQSDYVNIRRYKGPRFRDSGG